MRRAGLPRQPARGGGAALRAEALTGWAFLLPAGLLLALFLVWPALQVFGLSVTDYQLLAPGATRYVGLDNYRQLLHDPAFRGAVRVTLTFALGAVPLQTLLALALALALNLSLPGRGLLRAAFFAPTILSVVVAGVIWSYLYHPTQGLFNQLLGALGLPRQPFLSGRDQALPAIGALAAWQNVGFYLLIFLAGLRQIPASCREAAALDGANDWQQLRFITLPLLRPTSTFVVVVSTIYALRLFTEVYVLTRGGPFGATRTLIYFLWEEGLRFRHTAYAAAAAVFFFVLVFAITLVQRRLIEGDGEIEVRAEGRDSPAPWRLSRPRRIGIALLLGCLAVLWLAPIGFMLVSSLKPSGRMLADLGGWRAFWPAPFRPQNYALAFASVPLGRTLLNSALVAALGLAGALGVNSLAAYAFAVLRFPGRDALFAATVALLIVPFEAIVVPLFLTVNRLGWLNSYQGLIVPFIANPFYIFLFRQFFLRIPRALIEAARLDGASHLTIYRAVVLPLARPALATVAILEFVARWNDFFWPFLTLTDERKYTAQLGLAAFFQGERTQWALVMAVATIVSLPLLPVFLAGQRLLSDGGPTWSRR